MSARTRFQGLRGLVVHQLPARGKVVDVEKAVRVGSDGDVILLGKDGNFYSNRARGYSFDSDSNNYWVEGWLTGLRKIGALTTDQVRQYVDWRALRREQATRSKRVGMLKDSAAALGIELTKKQLKEIDK